MGKNSVVRSQKTLPSSAVAKQRDKYQSSTLSHKTACFQLRNLNKYLGLWILKFRVLKKSAKSRFFVYLRLQNLLTLTLFLSLDLSPIMSVPWWVQIVNFSKSESRRFCNLVYMSETFVRRPTLIKHFSQISSEYSVMRDLLGMKLHSVINCWFLGHHTFQI